MRCSTCTSISSTSESRLLGLATSYYCIARFALLIKSYSKSILHTNTPFFGVVVVGRGGGRQRHRSTQLTDPQGVQNRQRRDTRGEGTATAFVGRSASATPVVQTAWRAGGRAGGCRSGSQRGNCAGWLASSACSCIRGSPPDRPSAAYCTVPLEWSKSSRRRRRRINIVSVATRRYVHIVVPSSATDPASGVAFLVQEVA